MSGPRPNRLSVIEKWANCVMLQDATTLPDTVYLETEIVPLGFFKKFSRHFPFKRAESLDWILQW